MAAADDDHMLEVVAVASVIGKRAAQQHALEDDGGAGNQPEQHEHQAGEVHNAHDVERRHQPKRAQAVDQQDAQALLAPSAQAAIAVQAQRIVHQHDQDAVAEDERHQPRARQLQGLPAAQHLKAQPQRADIGQQRQHAVRDQIERIEHALIALNHALSCLSFASPVSLP